MMNLTSNIIEVEDSWEAVNDWFCREKLSDGLPIVPPTAERVERMLEGAAAIRRKLSARFRRSGRRQDRENRHQCGHGGLPAGIFAGGHRCGRSDVRAPLQPLRRSGNHRLRRSGAAAEWTARKTLNINCDAGVFGPGFRPTQPSAARFA